MLAQPSMIKRPVLDLGGGKLLVGFKPELYATRSPPADVRSRRSADSVDRLGQRVGCGAPPLNWRRFAKAPPHPTMPIDSFTVLLFGLLIKLVLGALFVVFWLKNRAAPWFGWWSASLLLGAVTSALYMWRGTDSAISVGLGNTALIAAFACCWQGARAFDWRRPLWSAVLVLPALWLAACFVPAFMASIPYRIVLSSAVIAPLLAMAAVEFWRGRAEQLPSRWPVVVIFTSFALFFAARVPLIGLAPFPFGALPMEYGWVGAFNLLMFAHTILLSVLLVSLSKERLELDQRTKAQTDPLTGALNRRAFMGAASACCSATLTSARRCAWCSSTSTTSNRSTTASVTPAATTC